MMRRIAEPNQPLTDEQLQAVDTGDSKIVTAGAGSGKTSVLTRRYLLYLATGIRPEEIVAITFTKKAAREMRERIIKAVAWEVSQAQPQDLEYWKTVRDELSWAQVTTIHGFYASLLRDYPLESGLDPGFGVLDEIESRLLRKRAASDLIRSLDNNPSHELLVRVLGAEALEEEGGLARHLVSVYTILVNQGHDPERVGCAPAEEDWRQCLAELVELAALEAELGERLAHRTELQELRSQITGLAAILVGVQEPEDLLKFLPKIITVSQLGPGTAPVPHKEFMKKGALICRRLLTAALSPLTSQAFLELLCEYSRAYTKLKQQQNALDFSDLQFRVRMLLVDSPEVAREIRQRYRRFMVDEFQDTDRLQKEIVWLLAADEGGRVADRLFIVGDEKQSIYRFRGADVGVFAQVRQDLVKECPGREVAIATNFRSRPALIRLVNQFFAPLMAGEEEGTIVYQPLKPHRPGRECSAELISLPGKEGPSQGEAIARRIRQLVDGQELEVTDDGKERPATWRDIAILIRSRTKLPDLERHLRLTGIPYSILGGIGFFGRREIRDLVNLLRVISNSLDDISLLGLLRSPLFALSDSALTLLTAARHATGGNLFQHKHVLLGEDLGLIERAQAIITSLEEAAGRLGLSELLELAVQSSCMKEVVLTEFGSLQAVANIDKFIDIARSFQARGYNSITDFLDWLEVLAEADSEGEAVVDSDKADTVRIMTIHASKGLEFPVVVIPGAITRTNSSVNHALTDIQGNLVLRQAWTCPSYAVCKEREQGLEIQETLRLLYVAMTRARDYLIITAQKPGKSEGVNFNRWLWEFAEAGNPLLPLRDVPEPVRLAPITGLGLPEPGASQALPPDLFPGLARVGSSSRTFRYFSISQFLLWKHDPEEFRRVYLSRWLDFDPSTPRPAQEWLDEPGGADFGSLLHRALELVESASNPRGLLKQLVPIYFPQLSEKEQNRIFKAALDLLNSYLSQSSPLANPLQCRKELVFYQRLGNGLFTGIIDKVLVAENKVAVIDYKSNRMPAGGVAELVSRYRTQLMFYAGAAQELFDRPAQAWLQLLRMPPGQQLVAVEFCQEGLIQLREELGDFVDFCSGLE